MMGVPTEGLAAFLGYQSPSRCRQASVKPRDFKSPMTAWVPAHCGDVRTIPWFKREGVLALIPKGLYVLREVLLDPTIEALGREIFGPIQTVKCF